MKKSVCSISLSLLLMLTLVIFLVACAEPSPSPAPSPSPTPSPTPTPEPEEPEVIVLTYSDEQQPNSFDAVNSIIPWLEDMENATGGRIKWEPYWSNTLSKPPDNWEAVKSGIADAAFCMMGFWPGLCPLSDVISLPLIGWENGEHGATVHWEMYETIPAMQRQWKDVHLMAMGCAYPYNILTTDTLVKTMDDLNGLKLRVSGGIPTEFFQSLGASPMMVAMSDVYMNLQKGVLDGAVVPWSAIEIFKFYESAQNITIIPTYSPVAARVMNLEKWNSLPPDIQEAINSVNGMERSKHWAHWTFDEAAGAAQQAIKDAGYEMNEYVVPAEELTKWQDAARPFWDKWVEETTAAGYPEAQEILDTTLELLEKYRPSKNQ
jgi:TRAP-type C4-dicarboxylate transport system substrate-binding protein